MGYSVGLFENAISPVGAIPRQCPEWLLALTDSIII